MMVRYEYYEYHNMLYPYKLFMCTNLNYGLLFVTVIISDLYDKDVFLVSFLLLKVLINHSIFIILFL